MQSLAPIVGRAALSLARNRKVRNFARVYGTRFAKRVGRRSLRRIQNRRRRRGRRQILPAMGRSVTNTSLAPVRVLSQRTVSTSDETVIDTEKTTITCKSLVGDTSSVPQTKLQIDPADPTLWPRLAAKAMNFAEYDIMRCVLTYTPAVGTNYNGSIVCGFVPQSTYGASDFATSTDVAAMQQNVTFSAGSNAEFGIDTTKMSQGGKDLFIDNTGLTPAEYTRYYAGTLVVRPFNCQDRSESVV